MQDAKTVIAHSTVDHFILVQDQPEADLHIQFIAGVITS